MRGLAVFASDPISSNAYATEAIMSVLALISIAALHWTLSIALVIALLVGLLLAAFDGDEIGLLPLYAIGVFTSFTLSQSGMVRLWGRIARLKPGESVDCRVRSALSPPVW